MITIARFNMPEQAHLLRTQIEAGGIQAYVQGENSLPLGAFYSDAAGHVTVEVADEDAEAAEALMKELEAQKSSELCPKCHSINTSRERMDWDEATDARSSNPAFIRGSGRTKTYVCLDCLHVWDEPLEQSPELIS